MAKHPTQQHEPKPIPTKQAGRVLRVSDLAPLLSVSKNTIWRWSRDKKSGFPPPIKLSPRVTVFNYEAVLSWLDKKQQAA